MKPRGITTADVIAVATQLNFDPTLKQMNEVVERYPSAQEEDSTATWNLVVENILYELGADRK